MKLLPENVRVLYIASDCVEPYVEVGLVMLYSGVVQCLFEHHPSIYHESASVTSGEMLVLQATIKCENV